MARSKALVISVFAPAIAAADGTPESHPAGGGETAGDHEHAELHAPHPFLAHMGIPEAPGMVQARFTVFHGRIDGEAFQDVGLHVEAGLTRWLGAHVRADGVALAHEDPEMMLMASPWISADRSLGISAFAQASVRTAALGDHDESPADAEEEPDWGVAGGVGGRAVLADAVAFDATAHIAPPLTDGQSLEVAIEGAAAWQLADTLALVGEAAGHFADHTRATALGGLKFPLLPRLTLGAGVEFPLTDERTADLRALLQLGLEGGL